MIERRYTAGPQRVGIQTRADGRPVIAGYAAVFYRASDPGTEYRIWDDIIERIKPGAFDRAIREDDVRALFNHDPSNILGRNTSGTLRLSVDKDGLRYEIDPPDTIPAASVVEAIKRGDLSGSSFGFIPKTTVYRDEKRGDKKIYVIEREEVELYDVSPVTFPAYKATSTGLRAAGDPEGGRAEIEAWRASQDAAEAYRAAVRERADRIKQIVSK